MSKPRDVVVVRVSEKGDREDEHFHSPEVQIEAARRWAEDRGERLVASPIPEIDVSGRLPLSKRPGLLAAIENPNVDIIAHPTGRLVGKRPLPSSRFWATGTPVRGITR